MEQLRVDGYPTTIEEVLARYPEIPDDDNAALILEKAFAHLRKGEEELELLQTLRKLPAESPLDGALRSRMQTLVSEQQECLSVVREATKKPRARFDLKSDGTGIVAAPHIDEMRKLADLLFFDAVLASEKGQSDEAVSDIRDLMKLDAFLRAEPMYSAQLSRIGFVDRGKIATERLLARATLDEIQLRSLGEAFAADSESPTDTLLLVVAAEGRTGMNLIDPVVGGGNPSNPTPNWNWIGWAMFGPSRSMFAETERRILEAGHLPIHRRYRAAQAAVDKLDRWPFSWSLATSMALSGLPGLFMADARSVADARVTLTSLALERYRTVHGAYPDDLTKLVPEFMAAIPIDPLDGKPLRYRCLDGGFVVYSVGYNGKDDGGSEERGPQANKHARDVVFKVAR
jgi:hypothetical protein